MAICMPKSLMIEDVGCCIEKESWVDQRLFKKLLRPAREYGAYHAYLPATFVYYHNQEDMKSTKIPSPPLSYSGGE